MAKETIFTKIINGDLPSYKIYEDELTFAFLDIYPVQEGHTLVIPKKSIEFVWDLDDQTYQALMDTTKKIALRLRKVLKTKYIGERVVGVDVAHAHVHLIPFDETSQLRVQQDMTKKPDHKKLAELAKKLAF